MVACLVRLVSGWRNGSHAVLVKLPRCHLDALLAAASRFLLFDAVFYLLFVVVFLQKAVGLCSPVSLGGVGSMLSA